MNAQTEQRHESGALAHISDTEHEIQPTCIAIRIREAEHRSLFAARHAFEKHIGSQLPASRRVRTTRAEDGSLEVHVDPTYLQRFENLLQRDIIERLNW